MLKLERKRLLRAGRPDLAKKVEHSSETLGDGLGFDLTLYTPEGQVVRIEVKTTRLGPNAAFFMSSSEMSFADVRRTCIALPVYITGGSRHRPEYSN